MISEEVRRIQRKQAAEQAARKLKEEIQSMTLSAPAMSQLEREAYRDAMRERVMQGRGKVYTFFQGHGPAV